MSRRANRKMSNRAKATAWWFIIVAFLAWNWLYFFCTPAPVQVDIVRSDIPAALSGMKIAQIADYHDGSWLWDEETFLQPIEEYAPDVIFLTGDMVEGRLLKGGSIFDIAHKLTGIAPVYAVLGNHEHYMDAGELQTFKEQLQSAGVTLLENESALLEYNGTKCRIIGVDDVSHEVKRGKQADRWADSDLLGLEAARKDIAQALENVPADGYYRLLLSHQPYFVQAWAEQNIGVVFSGHLHGGVVRLGDKGMLNLLRRNSNFSEADAGLQQVQGVSVYISRGASLSYLQPRINNAPEITLVQLVRSAE